MVVRAHLPGAGGAVIAAAVLAMAGLAAPGAAAPAAGALSGGTWGQAQEVLGALAWSSVVSVSCASPGNCSAGGDLLAFSSGQQQAMVVGEKNGVWGTAEKVPGTAGSGPSIILSVSCASPGNCSAGGYLSGRADAMVVSEKNGVWGTAEVVPGTAATAGPAQIVSVSCASPGNCSAGGYLSDSSGHHAFVVTQAKGKWGTAVKVPGLDELHAAAGTVNSVSCTSAGNCVAGGDYTRSTGTGHAFVAAQKNGRWGEALPISGMAEVASLSCASAGNCSAGGGLFVVSEANGAWGRAEAVPGLTAANRGEFAGINSVSCASAGNCSAGGSYLGHTAFFYQGFVVSQDNGLWGKAEVVPGLAALNQGGSAQVNSVSCASAGNCSAGGYYLGHSGFQQGFVVSQDNGTWGTAELVPGLAALNRGGFAIVGSVSCASAGNCGAGGFYENRNHRGRAFVVSQAR